jgi:hypothetical protein
LTLQGSPHEPQEAAGRGARADAHASARARSRGNHAGAATSAGPPHDAELEQLEAEAHYHRDRFNLYQARVISGSSVATSATRLRELKRTATAAAERLAHARKSRRRSP